MGKAIGLIVILAMALIFHSIPVWAGNQTLVEKRVQKLDEQNKRALDAIPEKPKDGEIILKSYIRNDKNEWVEYQVLEGEDRQVSKRGKIVLQGGKLP